MMCVYKDVELIIETIRSVYSYHINTSVLCYSNYYHKIIITKVEIVFQISYLTWLYASCNDADVTKSLLKSPHLKLSPGQFQEEM